MLIRTVSLWDPWGTLIATGFKHYETRSWATKYRGPLAIHVAKRKPDQSVVCREPFVSAIFNGNRGAAMASLRGDSYLWPLGCIVAVCRLIGCKPAEDVAKIITEPELSFGDFGPGRFAWVLADVKRLVKPFPCTGRQGMFDVEVPDGTEVEIVRPQYLKG